MSNLILEVESLHTQFRTESGIVTAVNDLSFKLSEGEILGIVGESGCGKSVTALSIMRLITNPPGNINNGSIKFKGTDLLQLSNNNMQKIRGNEISMIFQEPMTSLHPIQTIGSQLSEPLLIHKGLNKKQSKEKSIELLKLVDIPEPELKINEYPYQLSGGMRQRVMIAIALACDPKLLIADEPTTALDVTVQAQIMNLLSNLQKKLGTAIILITHDMGIIAEYTNKVIVMYAGKKVEEASVNNLFNSPKHPYTTGLLNSIPKIIYGTDINRNSKLTEIPGIVPSLLNLPEGCSFEPRCTKKINKCKIKKPTFIINENKHGVSCWNYQE